MQSEPNADADATPDAAAGREGLGRRIMLAVGVSIVGISAGIGWFVGSNGSAVASEMPVLGTGVTLPVTPLAFALYGVVISGGLLGLLFGLVELVSRAERAEDGV
ncbi:DUF7520 family protein [Halobellus rubicundus]|uniref:Cox cluster protein n=1 Tax=Halobellus rubicundus TaxID=2996466 RepID=A0ABD5MGN2_9EURY